MDGVEGMERLAARALTGDRDAWDALFARARDGLRRRVEARLGPGLRKRLEIDDVLQETCLRAYLSRERFEWRGEASFLGWLSTISEYVIRESARRHRRVPDVLAGDIEGDVAAGDSSPSCGVRRDERFERLLRAYERLAVDHRKVLRLVRLEGLSVRTVAQRMGRSESAVRHLVLRALQQLRQHFGESTASFHLPAGALDLDGARSSDSSDRREPDDGH